MADLVTDVAPKVRLWRRIFRRLRTWWLAAWRAVQPGRTAKRGATIALALSAAIAGAFVTVTWRAGFGPALDVAAMLLLAFIALALCALGAMLVARLISFIPRFLTWTGIGMAATLVFALTGWALPFIGLPGIVFTVLIVASGALLGGAVALLVTGGFGAARVLKKAWLALLIAAGIGFNAYVVIWLLTTGTDAELVRPAPDRAQVAPLDLEDPSKPGSFRVLTLSYGSGNNQWRAEFANGARLKTKTVDATPFVKGSKGWRMSLRRWYWGFDFKHFPVNGRIWYPDGPGPFPLVLIVHGNHSMEEYSDPGYAYLGQHLASRGFILVSVDENFFNGSFRGSLSRENDGRGWMLLQHLRVWKEWNEAAGNPFRGKVALDRIALMGHSRGGEAVAVAGAFNRLRYYPDDGTVEMPSGFAVRSLVAIAPVDGQYSPADRPTPLENVNYLTLQGGHDSDVSTFHGIRQWARVKFTDPAYHVKAGVYTYRANHGQFNTVWGDSDAGFPMSLLLNRKALLAGAAQRQVAKVFITSFLEATLLDKLAYLDVLKDERKAHAWLPDDQYVTRFEDSTFHPVANYEEDVDLTTATLPGARIEQQGLSLWREQYLPFKEGNTRDAVVYLGWKEPKKEDGKSGLAPSPLPSSYTITLPPDLPGQWRLSGTSELSFALSPVDEQPEDKDSDEGKNKAVTDGKKPGSRTAPHTQKKQDEEKGKDEKKEDPTRPERIDLSIELVSTDGIAVRLPLSQFRAVPVLLKARLSKFWDEQAVFAKSSEPVLQSFGVPLSAFSRADARFDPSKVTAIRFVFDRTKKGVVALDEVGFAGPVPTSRTVR